MTVLRAEQQRSLTVDGVSINLPSMDDAVSSIIDAAEQKQSFYVCTLNLDHLVQLRSRRDFREAYRGARFVTADGFPIVILSHLARIPIQRTTGADLVLPLCEEANRKGLSIFLLGSDQFTLAETKRQLTKRFRNLKIVGTFSPGARFDPYSAEADLAIDKIRESGARLCFAALGAPRQEIFAARCIERAPGVGVLCIGAALDFIAGTQERAPRFAQKTGLEWIWRASRQPRRLGPRYARCIAILPRLIASTIPQILDARMGQSKWRQ